MLLLRANINVNMTPGERALFNLLTALVLAKPRLLSVLFCCSRSWECTASR